MCLRSYVGQPYSSTLSLNHTQKHFKAGTSFINQPKFIAKKFWINVAALKLYSKSKSIALIEKKPLVDWMWSRSKKSRKQSISCWLINWVFAFILGILNIISRLQLKNGINDSTLLTDWLLYLDEIIINKSPESMPLE